MSVDLSEFFLIQNPKIPTKNILKKSRPSGGFWSLFTKNNEFSVLILDDFQTKNTLIWYPGDDLYLHMFIFFHHKSLTLTTQSLIGEEEKGPLYTVAITTHSSIDWIKQMSTLTLLFDPWHYTANERLSFWGSLFTDLITYFYLIFIVATCLAYRFLE